MSDLVGFLTWGYMMNNEIRDLIIIGGGLSGSYLAFKLKKSFKIY